MKHNNCFSNKPNKLIRKEPKNKLLLIYIIQRCVYLNYYLSATNNENKTNKPEAFHKHFNAQFYHLNIHYTWLMF